MSGKHTPICDDAAHKKSMQHTKRRCRTQKDDAAHKKTIQHTKRRFSTQKVDAVHKMTIQHTKRRFSTQKVDAAHKKSMQRTKKRTHVERQKPRMPHICIKCMDWMAAILSIKVVDITM